MTQPSLFGEPLPRLPGHAPGWRWRRDFAGHVSRPWAADHPPRIGGLCELGWHDDCPQAPHLPVTAGRCSCPCHQQ